MFRSACFVWAYGSPTPTTRPSGPVAVVPATYTPFPARTAREYPTMGSQGAPLEMSCRCMPFHPRVRRQEITRPRWRRKGFDLEP